MPLQTLFSQVGGEQLVPKIENWKSPVRSNLRTVGIYCRSAMQFFNALIAGKYRTCIVLQGKFLLYGAGSISIYSRPTVRRIVVGMWRRQPFMIYSQNHSDRPGLQSICELLGFDTVDQLSGYVTLQNVLIFFGEKNGKPVVSKFSDGSIAQVYLKPQHEALVWLKKCGCKLPIVSYIPHDFSLNLTKDYGVLVQSRLLGNSSYMRKLTSEQVEHRLLLASAPLVQLHRCGKPNKNVTLDFLDTFSHLPKAYSEHKELLQDAIGILNAWSFRFEVPIVLLHGDYQLKNILFEDSPLRLSGIVDWDRFRPQGWALLDALHLAVSSISTYREVSFGKIFPEIWLEERRSSLMTRYLSHIVEQTDSNIEMLQYVAIALWLQILTYRHADGQPLDASWNREIIVEPAHAILNWSQRSNE